MPDVNGVGHGFGPSGSQALIRGKRRRTDGASR